MKKEILCFVINILRPKELQNYQIKMLVLWNPSETTSNQNYTLSCLTKNVLTKMKNVI